MPVLVDDDMVVHGDAERTGDVDDGFGHVDIRLRRRRIAAARAKAGERYNQFLETLGRRLAKDPKSLREIETISILNSQSGLDGWSP